MNIQGKEIADVTAAMTAGEIDIDDLAAAIAAEDVTLDDLAAAIADSEMVDDVLVIAPRSWHADDGNSEEEYTCDSGEEAAQEYVDEGEWGDRSETSWIKVRAWREGIDSSGDIVRVDEESHKITLEAEEPECTEDEHDWQSPIEIVGGIKENPGVWGHGGGVTTTELCMHCGCERVRDTWAQDPTDGEQGLESVNYTAGKYTEEVRQMREAEAE